VMRLAKVQRHSGADLEALPMFKGKTLELDHYRMVEI